MRGSLFGTAALIAFAALVLGTAPVPRLASGSDVHPRRLTVALRTIDQAGGGSQGDLWLITPDGDERQLTRDGGNKIHPQLSPDQHRIAYGAATVQLAAASNGAHLVKESLRIIDLHGQMLRDVLIVNFEPGTHPPCDSVDDLHWIDNRRIGVECRIDPDNNQYMVVDADSGQTLVSYLALCCTEEWSPDGTKVAYLGSTPRPASADRKSNRLEINGKEVFPGAARRHAGITHTFMSELVWAPDSARVAFLDYIEPTRWQVLVIAGDERATVVARLPEDLTSDDEPRITWDDAGTVRLTVDQDYWTLDVASGEWDAPPPELNLALATSPPHVTPLTAFMPMSLHR